MGLAEIGSSIGNIGSSIGSIGAEVGGLGSVVASVGPTISSAGAVSGLGGFGEVMTSPLSMPISEGLAPASFLESSIPLTFNNLGFEIGSQRFDVGINTPVFESGLNAIDAISEAESILFKPFVQPIGQEIPSIFQEGLFDINLNPSVEPQIPEVFNFGLSDINLEPTTESIVEPEALIQDSITPIVEPVSDFVVTPNIPEVQPIYQPQIASRVEPRIHSIVEPSLNIKTEGLNMPEPVLTEEVKTESKQSISPKSFARHAVEIKPKEEIVEVEEEEVVMREAEQEKEEEEEKSQEFKLKRIVDEKAAKVRVEEIIEATIKADTGGEIDGRKIVEYLPGQHEKNRSGELNIIDPRGHLFDGSLLATIAKIASEKFVSLKQAFKKVPQIVYEDVPVTRGEGIGVSDEDVEKVYRYHKGKVPPAIEVIKRVIKIKKLVRIQPQILGFTESLEIQKEIENESEGKIKDHQDLAQALKAA